jgi:hypothetical protein
MLCILWVLQRKGLTMATMGFIQDKETTQIKNDSILIPQTFTHSIAFGETGCGKTSSFIYPNLMKRIEVGHGILLYDYKGKEHLSVKVLAEKAGRLSDVIEIGKPWGESVNLIEKMDEDELDKFFDNILKHSDDNKYWQNSAKSLGQSLLKVLKAIDTFANVLEKIEGKGRDYIEAGELSSFKYPTKRNLRSLISVCTTFEVLGNFITTLSSLPRDLDKLIQKSLEEQLKKGKDSKLLMSQYFHLLSAKEKLENTIRVSADSLKSFGEESNENLTQNIMGSLTSPLLNLSQNTYFNSDNFDIADALNAGKIVIVNVESLSNAVVETLNNSVLYELSKRTKSVNVHPVSVFIDEVQRVISENTDLPIDVFREAKVDIFLATQNSALLKDKLKEEKFDALMGNLTRKYYFKTSHNEDLDTQIELHTLQSFEYLSSQNLYDEVFKSKAVFIKDEVKLKVEYKYQKSMDILSEFLYRHKDKAVVLEYDARLYKENKIIAIDMKTRKESIHESLNKEDMLDLHSKVYDLFENVKERLHLKDYYAA